MTLFAVTAECGWLEHGVGNDAIDRKDGQSDRARGPEATPGRKDGARKEHDGNRNQIGHRSIDALPNIRGDIEGEADDGGAFQEPGAVQESEDAQPEQRDRASAQHAAQHQCGQRGQHQQQAEDQAYRVGSQHAAQIRGSDRHDVSFLGWEQRDGRVSRRHDSPN